MDQKDIYTRAFLRAADIEADEQDIQSHRKIWWLNLRNKAEGGLRLTEAGFDFINEYEIKTYEVEMPKELKLTAQILLWLDKFINSPYYIIKQKIYVLKESVAFELYLFSGDVKKLGYSKAMNKRLNDSFSEDTSKQGS